MNELIDFIYKFFIVRDDAYVIQTEDGYYKVDAKITFGTLYRHLAGEITIAVYSIAPGNISKWICFDLDENPKENAKKLLKYLTEAGYVKSAMIEKTGGRGYHFWIFFDYLYPAAVVRRFAIDILNKSRIVTAEVFPKQDELHPGGYGSAVRLPFGIHQKTKKRSVILYPKNIYALEPLSFNEDELLRYMMEVKLRNGFVEDSFKPPNHSTFANCIAFERIKQGVAEGFRDESAFFLARFYHWLGLPRVDTYLLLIEWDKLNKPPLGDLVIMNKIQSAYEGQYYVGKASIYENDVLKFFCVGCKNNSCKGFELLRQNVG